MNYFKMFECSIEIKIAKLNYLISHPSLTSNYPKESNMISHFINCHLKEKYPSQLIAYFSKYLMNHLKF